MSKPAYRRHNRRNDFVFIFAVRVVRPNDQAEARRDPSV
jgi:hypothetical protein